MKNLELRAKSNQTGCVGKRFRIGLAILLVVAFGIFADWMVRPREPVCQGKRLSVWLEEDYRSQSVSFSQDFTITMPSDEERAMRVPAQTAIRQIGTNAIPTLLKMLRARDSVLKTKMIALIERQRVMKWNFHTADDDHWLAGFGFEALGPIGKPAVPALTDLLKDSDPEVQRVAALSLGAIGPDARAALPTLIQHLNDQKRVGYVVAEALGEMKIEPGLVVPALIKHLDVSNTNSVDNAAVISALGKYGTQAEAAVPAIESMLNATNKFVLRAVTNALKQIDPEAAAKTGVK